MEDSSSSEEEDRYEEEEPCIPFTTMREAIAPHLLLASSSHGAPRRLRIMRGALLRLRRAAEAHLVDVFGISASLCELQRHSTLRLPAFRLAARLSTKGGGG